MSGLVLKLAPHEQVLINGAVIENCDRRTRLAIKTPGVNILRLRDAIPADQATTPVRRVCYIAQMVLTGEVTAQDGRLPLLRGIEQLSQALTDPDSRRQLTIASHGVLSGNHYQTLRALRALLPREKRLLAIVPT